MTNRAEQTPHELREFELQLFQQSTGLQFLCVSHFTVCIVIATEKALD